jgi:transcriptional regulator of acetoin/glycerol metabolism
VATLHRMVRAVRERGHVVGEGFFESRISTVAAPVRDAAGHTVAAIGITIPSDRLEPQSIPHLVEQVRETAQALSRLLDHTPATDTPPRVAQTRPIGVGSDTACGAWADTDTTADADHDEARDTSPATAG